jgi:hypothetical protein
MLWEYAAGISEYELKHIYAIKIERGCNYATEIESKY